MASPQSLVKIKRRWWNAIGVIAPNRCANQRSATTSTTPTPASSSVAGKATRRAFDSFICHQLWSRVSYLSLLWHLILDDWCKSLRASGKIAKVEVSQFPPGFIASAGMSRLRQRRQFAQAYSQEADPQILSLIEQVGSRFDAPALWGYCAARTQWTNRSSGCTGFARLGRRSAKRNLATILSIQWCSEVSPVARTLMQQYQQQESNYDSVSLMIAFGEFLPKPGDVPTAAPGQNRLCRRWRLRLRQSTSGGRCSCTTGDRCLSAQQL